MIALKLLSLLATVSQPVAHRYHVLLIGCARPNCPQFEPLNGVSTDLANLKLVLEQNWSVPESSIQLVTEPSQTTKAGIEAAIKKFLIDPVTGPEDVVFFCFGGHGCQVFDDSKATKLSQSIVPSDVKNLTADNGKGSLKGEIDPDSVIDGPEIGALFEPLKAKTTNVTLVFDSCHSGQVTRGSFKARGPSSNPAVTRFLARNGPQQPSTISSELGRRGLVCLSAASTVEYAWEDEDGGVFTKALLAALRKPTSIRTYQSIFGEVQAQMKSVNTPAPQDPQLEGDATRTFLGDEFVAPKTTLDVHMEGSKLILGGGFLIGLKPGFVIGLYPEGAQADPINPPWTATVKSVLDAGRSELTLTEKSDSDLKGDFSPLKANAQGLLIDGRPDGAIKVYVSELPHDLQDAVKNRLSKVPMVDLTAPSDGFDFGFRFTPGTPGQFDLVNKHGNLEESVKLSGQSARDSESIQEDLESLARRQAVVNLQPNENPTPQVEMRCLPVVLESDNRTVHKVISDSPWTQGQGANNSQYFAIQVRVTTTGFTPFLTLLNVNPHPAGGTQRVLQLWPQRDSSGIVSTAPNLRQIKVEDGWRYLGVENDLVSDSKPSKILGFYVNAETDGTGPEIFKLFGLDKDENFGPLLDPTTRSVARGGSPLALTLRNFSRGLPRSRGGTSDGPGSQHWGAASFTITVQRAK